MIIDCHCHAGKGDLLTGPWDTDAPMQTYLRRAKAAGIDKTVIFSPFHSNYRQANANTARIVASMSDAEGGRSHRFFGFAQEALILGQNLLRLIGVKRGGNS